MSAPPRQRVVLGLVTKVFLAGVLLAGCTGLRDLNIPVPAPGTPGSHGVFGTTTTVSDLTGDTLPTLPSTPPPKVVLTGGTSSLTGVVTGPNGVVAGATVLVERLVGSAIGSMTMTTTATGTWGLTNLFGGLYRIRAWMPPTLDLLTPDVMYLNGGATQSVNLTLMSYGGQSVNATVAPSPPQVGSPSSLVVNVLQEVVGADGVLRSSGLGATQVFILAAGNVVLAGVNPATTNSSGSVTLTLQCSSVGPVGLTATVSGAAAVNLSVPDCSNPSSTSTTPTTALTTTTT